MTITLLQGDCREVLPTLIQQFHSCVTDPPYLLNFMSKKWDVADLPPVDADFANWFAGFVDGEGCFSVHKKNVNGCETYDCQFSITLRADDKPIILEIQKRFGGIGSVADRPAPSANAGKQIRYCVSSQSDCVLLRAILTVFPLRAKKCRDFEAWSHALDCWLQHKPGAWDDMAYYRDALMAVKRYGSTFSPELLFHYRWAKTVYDRLLPGAYLLAFGGTRTYHRMVCAIEDAGFEIRDTISWLYGSGFPKSRDIGKAIEAAQWEGWGTALKPSHEPIVLARKPLSERTVAANVLAHGVGGLNIDACRVEAPDGLTSGGNPTGTNNPCFMSKSIDPRDVRSDPHPLGRWPANLVHDGSPEVLEAFAAFGERTSGGVTHQPKRSGFSEGWSDGTNVQRAADTGTAARFFYSAKADAADRADSKHPTVKPVDLIRWLVQLVTPPGGHVLDPFAGSGTTAEAAMLLNLDCTLIEQDPQHAADIKHRIKRWSGADMPLFAAE